MISRNIQSQLLEALGQVPVVALLGPRQVGKTTLALQITEEKLDKPTAYLDLELDTDLSKLSDPEGYLRRFENQLLIIDEVQLKTDLFRSEEHKYELQSLMRNSYAVFCLKKKNMK